MFLWQTPVLPEMGAGATLTPTMAVELTPSCSRAECPAQVGYSGQIDTTGQGRYSWARGGVTRLETMSQRPAGMCPGAGSYRFAPAGVSGGTGVTGVTLSWSHSVQRDAGRAGRQAASAAAHPIRPHRAPVRISSRAPESAGH